MTVRLIRHQAKELAGAFWEADRSERFRAFFPNVHQFIGRLWPDFVTAARDVLVDMLNRKDVSPHLKEEIADALVEDNKRAVRARSHDQSRLLLKADHPGQREQSLAKYMAENKERTVHHGPHKVH